MFKAIIIDDEPRARTLLKALIEEYCKEIQIIDECENLPSGVKAIHKHKPDLIFLDIEMPGFSGIELLEFFDEEEVNFSIIFTTAYHQYAIQAFKLSAIDYLLKPIEVDELEKAVARFIKYQRKAKIDFDAIKEVVKPENQSKIAIPVGNLIKFIDLDEVLFFKADSSYTEIVFVDQQKLLVSRTLKNFEEAIAGNTHFFRCHKSYLINTNFITDFIKSDGGYLLLKGGIEIPITPERVKYLLDQKINIKR